MTNQPGKYAGVNLVFTFTSGQVTVSPVLVHLPRIDNQETFLVSQNAATNQSYSFKSIPGLAVTVYAGTTFTMPVPDATQPNPFPLTAVQVPVDRLPDVKPPVPTMITAFIVAFQPANATTNQPVAVYYPNSLNTPPANSMTLLTLDPTRGQMVPYGTGTVSVDGTQVVPDADPAHPGHLYGLVHFDWHMPGFPPPNQANPCGICPCPQQGKPVDVSSGLLVINETDLSFSGARGTISLVRTYRSAINTFATTFGPFGYGTNHNFGYELGSVSPESASVINLIMPDGNQFPFAKQADGRFTNSGIPSLAGAVMRGTSPGAVELRWKNGTTFHFVRIVNGSLIRELLDTVTDANGNRTQILRSGFDITDIVDPVGRRLHFDYSNGVISQISDPVGRTVKYGYTGTLPAVLRTVEDPAGGIVRYDYDIHNNLTGETDARGVNTASNTYDSNGRVTQQRLANGGVLQFAYVLQNPLAGILSPVLQTTVTDARGHQTVYRFDAGGALQSVTDPLGRTRTLARGVGGQVTAITGSSSCAVCGDSGTGDESFSYDSNGNLLTQTDALGNTTTFTYETVFNRVTSIKDPLGNVTNFAYDSHGNLRTQKDANGNLTSYQYNPFGELTQTTDPVSQTTSFSYDVFGNRVSIYDPFGNTTSLQYDGIGRLLLAQDGLGRPTAFVYDPLNRIVRQTNAHSGVTRFTYDRVSNLLSVTDARNNTTSFTYDLLNQIQERTDPLGRVDQRTYDLNENLIQFQDRRGQTSTFTYDVVNRLVGEAYQDGSTVTRSYDANNRLARVNDSAGGIFEFTYDSAGRITNSISPYGSVLYIRDELGRATSRQVVGQPAVTYTYDKAGNLLTAATPAASVTQTYDARNLLATANRMNGVTSQYSYDPLGRLLSLIHSGPTGVLNSQRYSYDLVGNRNSAANSIAQSLVMSAVTPTAYDADNEQNQFGATTNTFDANGNLVATSASGGTTTFTWDSRNRLKSITTTAGQTTSFMYDFVENLLQQVDSGPSLNLTQTFVLDDLTNIAYASRSDGDQYSILAGRSLDGHFAVVHANGQIEYGLSDATNSTVATVDQSGTIKGQFTYEPFGQITVTNSNYPFQYTGRVPVSTSLYYYRARFYSPGTGRFIGEDPVGLGGGDVNLYRYVWNNPTALVDPLGLWGIGTIATGSAEGGDVVGVAGSGAVGSGIFWGGSQGVNIGTFVSGGGFAGGPGFGANAFGSNSQNSVAGGYIGAGLGAYFTNANSVTDLCGAFFTISVNTPVISWQLGLNGGTFITALTRGPGWGLNVSTYNTNTIPLFNSLQLGAARRR